MGAYLSLATVVHLLWGATAMREEVFPFKSFRTASLDLIRRVLFFVDS
jgi:hypothetical protein